MKSNLPILPIPITVKFSFYPSVTKYAKDLLEIANRNPDQFEEILWKHYEHSKNFDVTYIFNTYRGDILYTTACLAYVLLKNASNNEKELICRALINRNMRPSQAFIIWLFLKYLKTNEALTEISYDYFYHFISKGEITRAGLNSFNEMGRRVSSEDIRKHLSKSQQNKLEERIRTGDPLLFDNNYFKFASFFYTQLLPSLNKRLLTNGSITRAYLNEILKLNVNNFQLLITTWIDPQTILYSNLIDIMIEELQQKNPDQISNYFNVRFCQFISKFEGSGAAIFQLLTREPSVLGIGKGKEKKLHVLAKRYQAVLDYIFTLPQVEKDKCLLQITNPSSDLGRFFAAANSLSIQIPTFFEAPYTPSLKKRLEVLMNISPPTLILESEVLQALENESHLQNHSSLDSLKALCKKLTDNACATENYHISTFLLPKAIKTMLDRSIGEEVKAELVLYILCTIPPRALGESILKLIVPYKESVRETIGGMKERVKENLLDHALESTTTLGKFFWTKRGFLKTRITAGNLYKLSEMKNSIQKPNDVYALN